MQRFVLIHGRRYLGVLALAGAFAVSACEVKNPGAILDKDLNDEVVITALVTGMSSDFSQAMDDIAFLIGRGSDEETGSGSYFETGLLRRGLVEREEVNTEWGYAARARWVAEEGLVRIREVLGTSFDGNPLTARSYFLAGLANRVLGEAMCEAVFDGGPAGPNTDYFSRALPELDSAIMQEQMATPPDNKLITAARGALAQAYVGLGDWTNAVTYAAMVPTDFEYDAPYSDNSGREENVMYQETWNRPEMSAYGTFAGSFSPPDPRAPWKDCTAGGCRSKQGADGLTPHWRQQKYIELGADIPVVKGTEMRLIEAEARLKASDVPGAMGFINQVRTFYGLGMLSAATENEAWQHLDDERYLTLWLEGRRFFDLRRWDAAGLTFLRGVQYVYGLTSAVYDKSPDVAKRATCIPISQNECQTNPNVNCQ